MKSNNINFKDYEFYFFGNVTASATHPHSIIQLDNNKDILWACKTDKTIEQLKTIDIKITQSQMRLLQDYRLLEKEKKIFKTSFPILDSSKTEYLREIVKEAAVKIGSELKEEVNNSKEEGYEKNTYTILFSYILDVLDLDELGLESIFIKPITAAEPFWVGLLWAFYQKRNFSCGTN